MTSRKFKNLYLFINIPIIVLFLILFFTSYFITDNGTIYYIGIVGRVTIGLWCIFNGIWNSCTDYYSMLKNNRFQRNNHTPKWAWWIVFILGIGCLITAYMGYGFTNLKKPI